jgi:hypothetical protein
LFGHEGLADQPSHDAQGAARSRRLLLLASLFAEPNIAARVPGTPEDLSGALADPEPLFAAPTRLDRIGRVMTNVMVNGKGPFRFVIDTGASRSTLAPHLRERSAEAFSGSQRDAQRRHRRRGSDDGRGRPPRDRRTAVREQNLPVIFTSIMGNADGILGVAGFEDQRIDVDFKRDRCQRPRIERQAAALQPGDGARDPQCQRTS